jgi:ferric-dicitrate binding protein FerR (iron transport regulator)
VPASLLPFKKEWQAVANGMPEGSVLLCSTTANRRQRRILERVSTHYEAQGAQRADVTATALPPRPSKRRGHRRQKAIGTTIGCGQVGWSQVPAVTFRMKKPERYAGGIFTL